MHCCLAIRPPHNSQRILLQRDEQMMLSNYLESSLGYRPFVFNSALGIFVFTRKNESFKGLRDQLIFFLSTDYLNRAEVYDTSKREGFFMGLTRNILSSKTVSAFAWKRHINSFLLQLQPFHIDKALEDKSEIFFRFKHCVQQHGSSEQKEFMINRTRLLLRRACIRSIEDHLKN